MNFDRLLCHLGATAWVALGVCVANPAHAQSCNCEATPAQERTADALLTLTPAQRATSVATHLPFGVPVTAGATNETVLYTREYALNHDADLRTATWVGYRLTAADALARRARTDCFRRDLRLPMNQSSVCEDYVEPIFDRGHLVPNGDMQRSLNAQLNTFVLSNMAPQFNPFNGGIWATLEGYVRDWAVDRSPLFVVSGAIFDENGDGRRDPDAAVRRVQNTRQGMDRVGIATNFYKILLFQRPDGFIEVMALVLPHDQEQIGTGRAADEYLRARLTTIDEIETRTGINYLPGLEQTDPARARAVERSRATQLWPHN